MNNLNLSPKEVRYYAKTQDVTYAAIHNRMRLGWTLEQMKVGHAKLKKRSPLLKKINLKKIAIQQDISISAIYQRIDSGWTEEEIIRGYRHHKKRASSKWQRNISATSGHDFFLALVHIYVLSVSKLPNGTAKERLGNYKLTALVYLGIREIDLGFKSNFIVRAKQNIITN